MHAVADVDDDDGSDADPAEVLLEPQALIGREDHGEPAVNSSSQQDTIPQTLQALAADHCRVELDEIRLDLLGDGFVNEQPQLR